MDYSIKRIEVIKWVKEQLTGKVHFEKDPDESFLDINPLERFPIGALYPIIKSEDGLDPVSEEDEDATDSQLTDIDVSGAEPAIKRRRYVPPSSVGFSFYISGANVTFEVECSAVRYETSGERDLKGQFISKKYKRKDLGIEYLQFSKTGREYIFRGDDEEYWAGVDVRFRKHHDGNIITVSLFNNQEMDRVRNSKNFKALYSEKTLFESALKIIIHDGQIGDYPRVDYSLLDEEEQELELQYKNKKIYAVGHGAASDWEVVDGSVREIWSDFMPTVEVPQVTADTDESSSDVLAISHLANYSNQRNIINSNLDRFIQNYNSWIQDQIKNNGQAESREKEAGNRITNRMITAAMRMRRGLDLISSDDSAARAFELANQAMLDQMRQHDKNTGKNKDISAYKWRPFQLAFILTALESVVNENDEFRDVVDLIWFPTGGGKTEAYLGLIAFLIVWRRLKYRKSGDGTSAIMRYTLRLLTIQQFKRATRIICALELLRKKNSELGEKPITIGMWVGKATSPNTFEQAAKIIDKAIEGNKDNVPNLIITSCPWCNEIFKPNINYIARPASFHFSCHNPSCDFYYDYGMLPCNVIDESLYANPPSLLIATIDKFARFAWEERVNSFLGGGSRRPPELIIQDELHLIAGALGSIAGLYEAALDTAILYNGVNPKYIASTATIRMASKHIRELYGRDLAVFPPPGLNSEDSYFAKTVDINIRPGRVYIGYLAPMLGRQQCLAPLAASLLSAPEGVFKKGELDRDELLEAWWTQVVYHGSIKGVGNSHNSFNIDVREFYNRIVSEIADTTTDNESKNRIERANFKIAQLTSLTSAELNAQTFSKLEIRRNQEDCLDAVLATNMVSVGLDVGRLALMIINGQPLTTAEYIQASSRVGRSDVPGLVFINYYRDQARSLSHFENFRPYHDSFYRFVEPTSVTPFTYQARLRALHAALIISIRHGCRFLLQNDSAGKFQPHDDCVKKVIDLFKIRCGKANPERIDEIKDHINLIIERWQLETQECKSLKRQLVYEAQGNDRSIDRLLYNHDDEIEGVWKTLQSMRSVENTALLKAL